MCSIGAILFRLERWLGLPIEFLRFEVGRLPLLSSHFIHDLVPPREFLRSTRRALGDGLHAFTIPFQISNGNLIVTLLDASIGSVGKAGRLEPFRILSDGFLDTLQPFVKARRLGGLDDL